MEQGEIVESGNHKTLLEIEGGVYAQLYKVQFLEAEEAAV